MFINKVFPLNSDPDEKESHPTSKLPNSLHKHIPVYDRNLVNTIIQETKGIEGAYVNPRSHLLIDWEKQQYN
jgi:hypothetical protein